jgi:hypothetical protein
MITQMKYYMCMWIRFRCSDHFSVGLFVEIQFRYRPWINIEQVDCSLIFSILNNSIKLLYGSSISADYPYNNSIKLLYGSSADIDDPYNNLIELFKIENINCDINRYCNSF